MRCPHCDAEIADSKAAFCPRCGEALDPDSSPPLDEEAGATTREVAGAPKTREILPTGSGINRLLAALEIGGWRQATIAAVFGVLGALAAGAILVVAAKLQVPDLGSGAGPVAVLKAITIAGLGVFGAPISIGSAGLAALPLGALAAVGWLVASVVATQLGPRAGTVNRLVDGAKVGIPLAVLCWLLALAAQFGGERPISASATGALVFGGLWGALFGMIGAAAAGGQARAELRSFAAGLGPQRQMIFEAARAGGLSLMIMAAAAAAALLLHLILSLIGGSPSLGFGTAVAVLIAVLAFLPNALIAVIALSVGAGLEVGARVTGVGRVTKRLAEYSLFDWPGGPPTYAYALLLIPVIGGAIAGLVARRLTSEPRPPVVVIGGACVVALGLAVIAVLGDARLVGAALGRRGFVSVTVDATAVFSLALGWALVSLWAGWMLEERRRAR